MIECQIPTPKVLVVDDAEDILLLTALVIESRCHMKAITARTLRELEGLGPHALNCKVALIDINLGPEEPSGLDVYQWLRDQNFQGKIHFVTGHASSHPLVQAAKSFDSVEVYNKPLGAQELQNIVKEAYAQVLY